MAQGDVTAQFVAPTGFGCASFDGIDDRVRIPWSGQYNWTTGVFTISIWIKYKQGAGTFRSIFGNATDDTTTTFHLRVSSSNALSAIYGVTGAVRSLSYGDLRDGTWYNLTIVADGTTLYAYKNGTLVNSGALPSPLPTTTNDLVIGCRRIDNTPTDFFQGRVRDVRLYNVALNTTEITQLANSNQVLRGLMSHWKLKDDYQDTGKLANHGTNSGSVILIDAPAMDTAVTAARVTANDKYFIVNHGKSSNSVSLTRIEEA